MSGNGWQLHAEESNSTTVERKLLDSYKEVAQRRQVICEEELNAARHRRDLIQALAHQQAATGMELVSAESSLEAANAKLAAFTRLYEKLGTASVQAPHGLRESRPTVSIDITLPQSTVVIGWISIAELSEPQRKQVLEKLEDQCQVPLTAASNIVVEERELSALRQLLSTLKKGSGNLEEIKSYDQKVRLAEANLALRRAELRREQIERDVRIEQLHQLRECILSNTSMHDQNKADRQRTENWRQQVLTVLSKELQASDASALSASLRDFLKDRQQAIASLAQAELASPMEAWNSTRMLNEHLRSSATATQLVHSRHAWIASRLDPTQPSELTDAAADAEHCLPESIEGISRIVRIWFQRADLEAELAATRFQLMLHESLRTKLASLPTTNLRELDITARVLELLEHRIRRTEAQLDLLNHQERLAWTNSEAQQVHASQRELIDEETAELVLDASLSQLIQDSTGGAINLNLLRDRLSGLQELQSLGYASVTEVLAAEKQLLLAQTFSDRHESLTQLRRASHEILETVLATNLAGN